jgi:hypothetical protein
MLTLNVAPTAAAAENTKRNKRTRKSTKKDREKARKGRKKREDFEIGVSRIFAYISRTFAFFLPFPFIFGEV